MPTLYTIYLAPLQGMTDRIYRRCFPLYFQGVDRAVAPFLSPLKKVKSEAGYLRDLLPVSDTGLPTIPQILTASPDAFTSLANRLYELGFDTVNWNLGCPFRMVVKKGRGAGMLCYPDRIDAFLDKALPDLQPKLSIKLRLGFRDADDIFSLLPVFNRYPLAELIIHPRTGAQMYMGEVDLDRFGECLAQSAHKVVYNGDIDSAEKMAALAARFGSVAGWMIGRGLLGNPFLAEDIRGGAKKTRAEKLSLMQAFHDHVFEEYARILCGPAHLQNKMKEFWTYSAAFFEQSEKARKRINKTHTPDDYREAVRRLFDEAADSGTPP